MKKLLNLIGTFLIGALAMSGCNYSQDTDSASKKAGAASGNLRILATDDPFPYDSVSSAMVTISKIEMRQASGGGYIAISDTSTTLDLVQLRNGITSTLADLNVPAGKYDQVRLFISAAAVDLKDGRHMNLMVPSGAQTGLKVFVSPGIDVQTQVSTDLLLDFDISRSFIALGNAASPAGITGFNFIPVVRASNLTNAGTLAGQVMSDNASATNVNDDFALDGALVSVSQNGTVFSTAVTDADGHYKIIGLPGGSYDLEISATGYTEKNTAGIVIVAGNVLTEDATLAVNLESAPSPSNSGGGN